MKTNNSQFSRYACYTFLYQSFFQVVMLDKIKSVIQIKEELDDIKKRVDAQHSSMQQVETTLVAVQKLLEQFKSQQESIVADQKKIMHDFQKDRVSLAEHVDELKKEVFSFKVLKGQMQNDIMEKFEKELQQALKMHSQELQEETQHYKGITSQIKETANHLTSLHGEIAKLKNIAGNIKQEDFELSKTLHHVQSMEREKQILFERLDKAERFAAGMRRKNPQQR